MTRNTFQNGTLVADVVIGNQFAFDASSGLSARLAIGRWRIGPVLKPRPKIGTNSRYVAEFGAQLLDEAREEIGWGWQAAVLPSERVLSQHPVETLSLWGEVAQCTGQSWISPNNVRFTLQSQNPAQ